MRQSTIRCKKKNRKWRGLQNVHIFKVIHILNVCQITRCHPNGWNRKQSPHYKLMYSSLSLTLSRSLSVAARTSWRLCSALSIHYAQFYTNFMVQRYFRSKNSTKAALLWRCFFPSQRFTELSFFIHFCYIDAIVVIVHSFNLPLAVRRLSLAFTRFSFVLLWSRQHFDHSRLSCGAQWIWCSSMSWIFIYYREAHSGKEQKEVAVTATDFLFLFCIRLILFSSFFLSLCAPTQNLNTRNELKRSNACTWKIFSGARASCFGDGWQTMHRLIREIRSTTHLYAACTAFHIQLFDLSCYAPLPPRHVFQIFSIFNFILLHSGVDRMSVRGRSDRSTLIWCNRKIATTFGAATRNGENVAHSIFCGGRSRLMAKEKINILDTLLTLHTFALRASVYSKRELIQTPRTLLILPFREYSLKSRMEQRKSSMHANRTHINRWKEFRERKK